MTKGKPQTTKNNTAQENLTERLERNCNVDRECTSDHCRGHIIDQSVYGAEGRNIPYLEK